MRWHEDPEVMSWVAIWVSGATLAVAAITLALVLAHKFGVV